jgi:HEAT repeat protein
MGRYDAVRARTGWGLPHQDAPHAQDALAGLLALSEDPDARARRVAAKHLCPCHIRADVPEVWDRLLELARDPDAGVRRDAVHALGDGSPRHRHAQILEVLTSLRNDPDRKVRRQVWQVLAAYRRTGRINVL